MKQIRKRFTYANVMSSLAVFLVLGGATAVAAKKIGSNEIKGNSITTGKIKKEAVTKGKLKNGSVSTEKLANDAVTGAKANESTFSQVPSAADSEKLAGVAASGYQRRSMWAVVSATGTIVSQSGGISLAATGSGTYYLLFPENVVGKAIVATPISSALGSPGGTTDLKVAACGTGPESATCAEGPDSNNEAFIATFAAGSQTDVAFYIAVLP